MKHETSFLTRCFAMFLAVLMALTGSNVGVALQAFAAEPDDVVVNIGKLVADNYELTAEEEALLASGCLTGGTITYTVPTGGAEYVTVDAENKEITAEEVNGWIPTIARIKVGAEVIESIALDGGKGKYTYTENAFSVEVDYALYQTVDAALQETLLNTAAWLKDGIANLDTVSDQLGNLYILEQAMPALVDFAVNGVKTSFTTITLSDKCKTAVFALNDQMTANDGQLDLSVLIAEYDAASKTNYLLNKSVAMKAAVADFAEKIEVISSALATIAENLDWVIEGGFVDETTASNLKTLAAVTKNLNDVLALVNAAEWTAAEKGTALVSEAVDYAALDALVAALGELTAMPTIREILHVADTTLTVNMSMFNVTVVVSLTVVENKADSNELIECAKSELVLTLAEGVTAEEIKAAVEESGIVDFNLDAWAGLYVAEHFNENSSELPETLIEDITYEIKFAPKTYHVMTSWGEEMDVYYGYQMTLPAHDNAEQAYDYTVNGEAYAQGEVVVITGNTNIERTSGKAYAVTDFYTVVSNNYGDALAQAILQSGALNGNTVISVRKPDPADAESILQLLDGMLKAQNYNAAYAGLSWVPYSYNGSLFNGASEVPFSGKSAEVVYRLDLTNFSKEQVAEVLALAAQLKNEAAEQKSAMDSLAGMQDTLVQLDKTKLGALNGVIDVTDFTPGDGTDTDAENLEIRAEMKAIVSAIIANNLDSNNYLKIYNIVVNYNTDGFVYYYKNFAAIKAEINSLAGYLTNLMDNEDALRVMCTAAGYGEYADKIADVETKLNDYNARMSEPNAAIDLSSANLGKLVSALVAEGEVVCAEAGYAYLVSDTLTALDESSVMVQVIINANGKSATVATESMDRGTILTADVINALKQKVNDKVAELIGDTTYYNLAVEGGNLDALIGTEIIASVNLYYTYTAKEFTVKIDGEADQIVTINDLEINLPKHPTTGWKYEYTIDGVSGITASTYTFTVEQLNRLFVDGTYTITRIEINQAAEDLENRFGQWAVRDENGNIIALNAEVDGDKNGIMDFAMTIVNAGYTYIGLNGEPLLYMNEEDTLEICLQTLVNAILNDNDFSSQTLIDLGTNGNGKLVSAQMQLGNSASDAITIPFTMTLTSVPGKMATVANGLNTIKPYMTFNSNNGVMDIKLNLPEKLYEIYLAGMLVTGNVTKDNMDAINSEIAFQFFYDYIEYILASDATTTTFSNTLEMLGKPYDLTGYEEYYQMVKKAMTSEGVQINPTEDGKFDMTISGRSQKAINALINLLGLDVSAYEMYLGMIKEYKYEDATLGASANAILVNTESGFEAALVDLNAAGIANKFDFTKDLPARCNSIADKAAIILLDTVDGDLVFNGTTILDLNGQTVNGNIVSNGTLIIVDSALDTDEGGYVTGAVTGNVTIIAGKYAADVSAFLKDGYKQVNGAVQNALYTIESDGNDVTFVVNTDVMNDESVDGYVPNVRALAVDIAVDLILNYYTAAALTADGNTIYNLHVDDLVGLYASSNRIDDLIQVVLDCVNLPELSNFANIVLEDLLDFGAIADALESGDAVATYTLGTTPWAINLKHVTEGDYITVGFGANNMERTLGKEFDVALKFVGSNKDRVVDELRELGEIVDASATIDLKQPVYEGASNSLYLVGNASASATLTMNQKDVYANILALVLANGNADVKDELVAAVNAGDRAKMKDIIDEMTVADLFAAMKALNRNESFVEVATKLGVTADVSEDTDLEKVAHLVLTALGKVLEELDITGMNSKFGALDKDDDGIYEFSADATRKPDASFRGYTVYAEASVAVSLTVNLFGRHCIVGDVNHDGVVDIFDMAELTLILAYPGEYDIICEYCADVNQDGVIDVFDMAALTLMLANAQ